MGRTCCADNCRSQDNSPGIRLHSFPNDTTLRKKWVESLKKDYKFELKKNHRLCTKHFEEHYLIRNRFGNVKLKPEAVPSIFVNNRRSFFKEIFKNSATSDDGLVPFPLSPQHIAQSTLPSQHSDKLLQSPLSPKRPEEMVDCLLDEIESANVENEQMETSYQEYLSPKQPEEIEHNYCILEKVKSVDKENEQMQTLYQECSEKKDKSLRVSGDFSEQDLATPHKRKMFWNDYQMMCKEDEKRIRYLEQRVCFLQEQVFSLNNLVVDLQKKK